jgi:hypothetical protein
MLEVLPQGFAIAGHVTTHFYCLFCIWGLDFFAQASLEYYSPILGFRVLLG